MGREPVTADVALASAVIPVKRVICFQLKLSCFQDNGL